LVQQGDIYQAILKMEGKLHWEGDLKAMRRRLHDHR
jgi:hypothetical protein